ncbi:MAG: NYN domain-containing protein [Candidatus Micrarchaeota archaeon]
MPKPSIVVLIDGSNLYHAVKAQTGKTFDRAKFEALFLKIQERHDITEIRFYDAVKDRLKDPAGYAKQQKFHAELGKIRPTVRLRHRKLRYLANLTQDQVLREAKSVGIIDTCKNKLWNLLHKLRLVRLTKEKGVDVLLVVDAVELARAKAAQCICLVTGDADFTPAVELIRSMKIKTLNLHTYSGSSTELRQACDEHALIQFDGLGNPSINWYD